MLFSYVFKYVILSCKNFSIFPVSFVTTESSYYAAACRCVRAVVLYQCAGVTQLAR